jgi:hypothetical protein
MNRLDGVDQFRVSGIYIMLIDKSKTVFNR